MPKNNPILSADSVKKLEALTKTNKLTAKTKIQMSISSILNLP
tara:strand:- start:819 stop:947 length:129 start_codon:yes stop_codon:yes gene_type:complete